MKTKVNWKSLGHSAKRWHGITLRNDLAVTSRGPGHPKKKGGIDRKCGSSRAPCRQRRHSPLAQRNPSERPRRPDRVGKEKFNEEIWGQAGICLCFRCGSSDGILCEALPRAKRTLRLCGHEYEPALLAGSAGGFFGRGQITRSKR